MSVTPDKLPCLVVCAQSPSNTTAAGNRVAREQITELARRYTVDLVLILNRGDPVSPELARELGVQRLVVFRLGVIFKLWTVLRHLFSIPPRYGTRLTPAALRFLREALAANRYALVRYEFSQVAPYHLLLRPRVDAVLALHDVQLQVVLRAPLVERLLFSASTYRYEELLYRSFDKITVPSQKDKSLIDGLYPYCKVELEPPTLSPFVYKVNRVLRQIEPKSLLFWGAMNRPENEEAVLFFVRHCLPELKAQCPGVTLYVVGNAPSRRIKKLNTEQVIVTGFVEDPRPYFARSAVGIVPILRGAGLKLKTLEMLSAGLPVVSTYVGAEGVDVAPGQLDVVAPGAFAKAVIGALKRHAQHSLREGAGFGG